MENKGQTSSGPIWTFSLGADGAGVFGLGCAGVVVLFIAVLQIGEFGPAGRPVARVAPHECGLNAVLNSGGQVIGPLVDGLIRDPDGASGIGCAAQFADGVGLFHQAIEP